MSEARLAGDLNRGGLLFRLVTFGIPLVLGMFFHSLFNLVDFFIVMPLGSYALAAVNQASLVNFVPMLISNGVNNASIAFMSRNFGMRNYKRANAIAMQSFLLLILLAAALGWPSYRWSAELCVLAGSGGKALAPARDYLEINSAGLFTMFALMQVTAVLRAGGNARWPMILLIGGNVSNAILSYAWVFGKWGFPASGVAGAAWGTVVSRGLFALLGLYIITRQAAPIRLVLWRPWPRLKMLWQLFALGVPSSMQFVVRVVGFGAIQNFANRFGEREEIQAALAVGSRLDMLATFTGAGWGAASAALVGQALGAGLPARAERAGWYATLLNVLLMGGIGAAYLAWCHDLVGLWVRGEARVQELAVHYLQVAVLGYPVAAVAVTLALSLNGAGSTKMPLFLDSLGFLGAQIPIAWWLAHRQEAHPWGRESLWWSIVGTTAFVALLYTVVWRKGHWKHKKLR